MLCGDKERNSLKRAYPANVNSSQNEPVRIELMQIIEKKNEDLNTMKFAFSCKKTLVL